MHTEKAEKKVEYLELIYDLIFVFVIGRNNALLHHTQDGFISAGAFISYITGTLAVIQIWNFTTYYINTFGTNGAREHISLFINMFLMYFIAEGIGGDTEEFFTQSHIAWALILINIGVQYLLELGNFGSSKDIARQVKKMSLPLFVQAAAVLAAIPVYRLTGAEISLIAIALGIVISFVIGAGANEVKVDFPHLTERAMLYVVFTFGEMIISLSGYFDGELTAGSLYFSVMGFLVAAALFLSYETLYDHIVDRGQTNNGLSYSLIHIIMIFALNNITVSLEFMRSDSIDLLPKMLMLTGSLLLYYLTIFLLGRYAKKRCAYNSKMLLITGISAAVFAILMIILREYMKVNILLTVVFCFGVFITLHRFGKEQTKE